MRFILYSPVKFEDWDWRSCDRGIGGSETSHIQMAKELAKRGHEVITYAPLPADTPSGSVWEGTKWFRLEEVDWEMPGWWMLYRCPQAIDNFDPSRKDQPLNLMFQDWDYRDSLIGERIEKLGRAVVLCRDHERYLLRKCPELKGKTWVTRNGIRNDLIRETEAQGIPERNINSMMFASSPDRGLKEALQVYARVKEAIPDFEFTATYGFNNIDKLIAMGAKHFQKEKDECMRLVEKTGANFSGRLTQQQLYQQWMKTGFWSYITNFFETGCAEAGTLVFTKNGHKKIEDIQVGDLVLTHKGRFMPVTKLSRRIYEGKMYATKRKKDFRPIEVTELHPLLVGNFRTPERDRPSSDGKVGVRHIWMSRKKDHSGLRYSTDWVLPANIDAERAFLVTPKMAFGTRTSFRISDYLPDLKVEDGIVQPKRNNPLWKRANDLVELSEEVMYLLGNFAAEGSAIPGKGKKGKGREWFSLIKTSHHSKERHIAQKHADFFGGKVVDISENEVQTQSSNSIWARLLNKIIGVGRGKHIPDFVWETDESRQRAFLQGYLDGDGYKSKSVNTDTYSSVSPSLTYGMAQILTNIGLYPSVHYSQDRDAYTVSWQRESVNRQSHVDVGDSVVTYVESVTERWFSGEVFNFEVEEDRSYVTDRTVVHNCITALEAMSLGAVPIFSPIYAQGENIKHGVAVRGRRDDEGTIARAAFEIVKLARHPERMAKIRSEMIPDTRRRWGWERFAIGWETAAARDLGEYRQKAFSFPVELKPGMTVVDVAAGRDDFAATAKAKGATVFANEPSSLIDDAASSAFGEPPCGYRLERYAIGDPAVLGPSIGYIDTPEISGIRTPVEDVVLPVATVDALVAEWLEPGQRIDILRLDCEAQIQHAAESIKRSDTVVIGDRIVKPESERPMVKVKLSGGPFDGREVDVKSGILSVHIPSLTNKAGFANHTYNLVSETEYSYGGVYVKSDLTSADPVA